MKARALVMLLLMVFLPSVWMLREMNFQPSSESLFLQQRRMPLAAELRAEDYARGLEKCDVHHECFYWTAAGEKPEGGVVRAGRDVVVGSFPKMTTLG